ncbi:DDE_4 domain-containing protein, partial [Cephalotus follicularis]
ILRDAISRVNGLKVPQGQYYLCDAGYTYGEGFLAPYRGQRYHSTEWSQGYQPTIPQEFFNMKHSSTRNVIERCFGILKMRWAILRFKSYYPVKTQCRIISACCLLHNYIRREMAFDPVEALVGE